MGINYNYKNSGSQLLATMLFCNIAIGASVHAQVALTPILLHKPEAKTSDLKIEEEYAEPATSNNEKINRKMIGASAFLVLSAVSAKLSHDASKSIVNNLDDIDNLQKLIQGAADLDQAISAIESSSTGLNDYKKAVEKIVSLTDDVTGVLNSEKLYRLSDGIEGHSPVPADIIKKLAERSKLLSFNLQNSYTNQFRPNYSGISTALESFKKWSAGAVKISASLSKPAAAATDKANLEIKKLVGKRVALGVVTMAGTTMSLVQVLSLVNDMKSEDVLSY